jgi:hypothetical protein
MYVNSPVLLCSSYSTPPLAPLTDRNKPAVWAATPREAGWMVFINFCQLFINPLFSILSFYFVNYLSIIHFKSINVFVRLSMS